MSQIRKDVFNGRWVIMAESTAVRPSEFGCRRVTDNPIRAGAKRPDCSAVALSEEGGQVSVNRRWLCGNRCS